MDNIAGASLAEIWKKMDELGDLNGRIERALPEFDYVVTLHEFRKHLALARQQVDQAVGRLRTEFSSETALSSFTAVKFAYFGAISVHLALETYLYTGSKDLQEAKSFRTIVDAWKAAPECRLMKGFRNRMQHGVFLPGILRLEKRTAAHPSGEGVAAVFEVGDEWEKVLEDVNGGAREYFVANIQPKSDRLLALLEVYDAKLRAVIENIEQRFSEVYERELDAERQLKEQRDDAERWLESHGLVEPKW